MTSSNGTANLSSDRVPSSRSLAGTFTDLVLVVSDEARRLGLHPPFYRSPPKAGLDRSIRRRADGAVVVAVTVRGRDVPSIARDVVDGVVAANGLTAAEAVDLSARLLTVAAAVGSSTVDGLAPAA
jgi:hypothetical protein